MEAQARLVARRWPGVLVLQEVFILGCENQFGIGACENPTIAGAVSDFLELTRDALDGAYDAAASFENFKMEFPLLQTVKTFRPFLPLKIGAPKI